MVIDVYVYSGPVAYQYWALHHRNVRYRTIVNCACSSRLLECGSRLIPANLEWVPIQNHSRKETIGHDSSMSRVFAAIATVSAPGPAATRGVRRDHAGDGRHGGVGTLHEPECRGAAGAHPVSDPRGVGGGRGAGPAGGIHLGGAGDAAAGGRGTVSLFARGVSSGGGVRL